MSYTIEKLPGEPIILSTGGADFTGAEGPQLVEDMYQAVEHHPERIYLISDMSAITMTMDDVLQGSSLMTRGQKAAYSHPNVIENVFVTRSNFIKMAAKGLSAPIFGGLQVRVVETLDEALSYCRSRAAGS